MTNFRSDFHLEVAQTFLDDIQYERSKYYYFIGKVEQWNNALPETPENSPADTQADDKILRGNMVYVKKVTAADVTLATSNYTWEADMVFEKWDHTVSMRQSNGTPKPFYCITSEYRVYKCLDNVSGQPSTVEPYGTSTDPIRLTDGYLWKYMYTVPSVKRSRFITGNYIPVQRALSDNFFNRGEITAGIVKKQGSGYPSTMATTIIVTDTGHTTGTGATLSMTVASSSITTTAASGNGTTATLTFASKLYAPYAPGDSIVVSGVVPAGYNGTYTVTACTTTTVSYANTTTGAQTVAGSILSTVGSGVGQIDSVTVVSGGTGYTKGAKIVISTSTGKGAALTPVIVGGVITDVEVTSAGYGYDQTDTISVVVGGAVILPKVSATSGEITGVIIKDPGIGYVSAPTLASSTGIGKFTGNTNPILKAIVDDGKLYQVAIEDPGKNVAAGTATTISVGGDGTGCLMRAVVDGGKLLDIIVDNPGSGYTYSNIAVLAASGSGAEVTGVIDTSDFSTDQSVIEQTAVPGAIYSIGIANQGIGYEDPTVNIVGDGSGAEATCVLDADGKIVNVNMISYGTGYTYANVSITDTSGSNASLYAILPPPGGHGANAPFELYADVVEFNTSLRESVISTAINQDYRQFGILKNPLDAISFTNFTADSAAVVYKVELNSITGLLVDEVLTQGASRYRVVEIHENTSAPFEKWVYLNKLNETGTLTTGSVSSEITPVRTYTITSVLETPTLNKFSGHLLYISNEAPFKFTPEQSIIIKTFIRF